MSKIVDFLFWWVLDPRDDWPHLRLILLALFALLMLLSTGLVVEDLRNPYAKHKKWLRPARPGLLIATYLAIGVGVGAVGALVLPAFPVAPTITRCAGLLVISIAIGVMASGAAHLRSPARTVSPRLVFWEYFALVVGLFATRLAL